MAIACTAVAALAGPATGPAPGQKRVAPKNLKPDASCLDKGCHGNLTTAPAVHKPVAKKACDVCHEQDDEALHAFTYPDTGSELCYGCHASMTNKKFVHDPLKDKKRPCLSCHDPHSGKAKYLLKAAATTDLCLKCHAEMAKGPRMHRSRAAKGCTGCHLPHSAASAKFLRADPPGLCYTCHGDLQEDLAEAKVVHGPVAAGCVSCHNPHQELAGKGLKKSGADLCVSCHDHFKARSAAMEQRHSKTLEKNGCLGCHAPHFSPRKALLAKSARKLCLSCHDKNIKAGDGRLVKSPATEMVKGARLHGPLGSNGCGGCHEPHGNKQFAFLLKPYPATFYSPYTPDAYALCFSCHDASLATADRTTTATGFRNGNVNLHFVHVNKKQKGRTCRACHAAHASRNPHMLIDAAPFGQWKIPIRFAASKDGGACASGCHRAKAYRRGDALPDGAPPASKPASRPARTTETTTASG